ncbi:secreted RxLR effector protein 161-like [Cicer arietinum]|uniref:secreted RxLR effector protein 161-like n=1 Tax=Cicer arietinum TaxID=3827 RepID=UPI003CC5E826
MTCTRPDITYVVGRLSRYTSNPILEGYTYISWINHVEDHASTSGRIFNFGGGAVSWGSKKQTCIADSTMTAEFIALTTGSKEVE